MTVLIWRAGSLGKMGFQRQSRLFVEYRLHPLSTNKFPPEFIFIAKGVAEFWGYLLCPPKNYRIVGTQAAFGGATVRILGIGRSSLNWPGFRLLCRAAFRINWLTLQVEPTRRVAWATIRTNRNELRSLSSEQPGSVFKLFVAPHAAQPEAVRSEGCTTQR